MILLMDMLLSKEEVVTRVEVQHCKFDENRDFLKSREKQIGDFLARIKNALAATK
jgi:energy-converting hydrogenase Eha subunit H